MLLQHSINNVAHATARPSPGRWLYLEQTLKQSDSLAHTLRVSPRSRAPGTCAPMKPIQPWGTKAVVTTLPICHRLSRHCWVQHSWQLHRREVTAAVKFLSCLLGSSWLATMHRFWIGLFVAFSSWWWSASPSSHLCESSGFLHCSFPPELGIL